ncbi:hypothetical protein A3768_5002 (plasmid) [Ralstonia solanacearum]|nr:hypothetical protein A3768_5002 [Ralstonia solanacearum]
MDCVPTRAGIAARHATHRTTPVAARATPFDSPLTTCFIFHAIQFAKKRTRELYR